MTTQQLPNPAGGSMKPINEMSLAECIERLRELPNGTVDDACDAVMLPHLPWIFEVAVGLADRIDTLLYEQAQRHDARVDALENEINALRAKNRWIPVEERMPTEEDADRHGYVQWWSENEVAIPVAHCWDFPFAHFWEFTGVTFTHWRRIDTPDIATPSGQVAGMRYE
jgi:hypothetical protein